MDRWAHGYYHMTPFGWVGMILFWAALILLIVWLVRSFDFGRGSRREPPAPFAPPASPSTPRGDRAMEIARERYAKGEIDAEQFEKLKRDVT